MEALTHTSSSPSMSTPAVATGSASGSGPNSPSSWSPSTHSAIADSTRSPHLEPTHSNHDLSTILQSSPPSAPSQRSPPSPVHVGAFLDDTLRTTPSPPSTTSTINALARSLEQEVNYTLFGYHICDSPSGPRLPLPIASRSRSNMAPTRQGTTRQGNTRPARLANGYVDLTSGPDSPDEPIVRPPPRRTSPNAGPSKRLKRNDGSALRSKLEETVDKIDLSGEKHTVQDVLQKQRQEAVKAQERPEEKAVNFNTFTCVICMDTPTDLTATACGHLFCHTCLMEALIVGENRAAPGEPKRSQCPVCRKHINRLKSNEIIPLLLSKGLGTQPRRKASVPVSPKVAS